MEFFLVPDQFPVGLGRGKPIGSALHELEGEINNVKQQSSLFQIPDRTPMPRMPLETYTPDRNR